MSQTIEERVAAQEVLLRVLSDQITALSHKTEMLGTTINSTMASLTEDRGADSRRIDTLHRDIRDVSNRLATLEQSQKPLLEVVRELKEWQRGVVSRATWTATLIAGLISFAIAIFAASGTIKEYLRVWIMQ